MIMCFTMATLQKGHLKGFMVKRSVGFYCCLSEGKCKRRGTRGGWRWRLNNPPIVLLCFSEEAVKLFSGRNKGEKESDTLFFSCPFSDSSNSLISTLNGNWFFFLYSNYPLDVEEKISWKFHSLTSYALHVVDDSKQLTGSFVAH